MIADARLNPEAVELGPFLRRPSQEVWRALTDPEMLARWLLRPIGFAAWAGNRFRFVVPGVSTDHVLCEVLAAQPCARLTYSWTHPQGAHPDHWIVDWELRPEGHGTRLLLTQTGFDPADRRQRMVRNAVERSWKRRILPRLDEIVHS
ncbi:SRPBCC family protein [Nocardia thailandica]|uniref:SRPBCC family protein n=1 Tax=Nocardia thailandica TaxID=257275 RepID=UPI00031663A9|nr:SRPBCC domain-containing protein [Nocardia thailandica]